VQPLRAQRPLTSALSCCRRLVARAYCARVPDSTRPDRVWRRSSAEIIAENCSCDGNSRCIRNGKPPTAAHTGRQSLILAWAQALKIIKWDTSAPSRSGLFWRWKSQAVRRPPLPNKLRCSSPQRQEANPSWGEGALLTNYRSSSASWWTRLLLLIHKAVGAATPPGGQRCSTSFKTMRIRSPPFDSLTSVSARCFTYLSRLYWPRPLLYVNVRDHPTAE
jgi:hypothetical protein